MTDVQLKQHSSFIPKTGGNPRTIHYHNKHKHYKLKTFTLRKFNLKSPAIPLLPADTHLLISCPRELTSQPIDGGTKLTNEFKLINCVITFPAVQIRAKSNRPGDCIHWAGRAISSLRVSGGWKRKSLGKHQPKKKGTANIKKPTPIRTSSELARLMSPSVCRVCGVCWANTELRSSFGCWLHSLFYAVEHVGFGYLSFFLLNGLRNKGANNLENKHGFGR